MHVVRVHCSGVFTNTVYFQQILTADWHSTIFCYDRDVVDTLTRGQGTFYNSNQRTVNKSCVITILSAPLQPWFPQGSSPNGRTHTATHDSTVNSKEKLIYNRSIIRYPA